MPFKSVLAISLLLLTSLTSGQATSQRPRGVAKSKAHLYVPSKDGTWKCLDGSKVISFDQDYCDCPDGSDEPGTSACPNGQFYCANSGHISSYIPSSHVNDGICDPDCCDGSDEYDGQIQCPNTCKELGAHARKEAEENAKLHLKGQKIRQSYIEKAKVKKAELEAERDRLLTKVVAAEEKERDLKNALERAEIKETKVSKFGEKIADKAREKIEEYKKAISKLRDEIEWHTGRVSVLEGLLEGLKNDHNQNYHDMAVKKCVQQWEGLKEAQMPDFEITIEELDALEKEELDLGDDDVDFTNEFDETVSLLWRVQDYFPVQVRDFIKSQISYVRSILADQGFLPKETPGDGTVSRALQKARDAHQKAVTETSRLQREVDTVKEQISADYGPDDVFRAIKGDCVSLDTGEYTYTVCMMDKVTQKSNKDGANTNLGAFSNFDNGYKTMVYDRGAQCWNGPQRSARIDLECGAENLVLKVTEPSKCEYYIKMKSPAVCLPPKKNGKKDEL